MRFSHNLVSIGSMFSWVGVHTVSPTGLKLNRAWHVRQLLFALIPPLSMYGVCLYVFQPKYEAAVKHIHNLNESMKIEVNCTNYNSIVCIYTVLGKPQLSTHSLVYYTSSGRFILILSGNLIFHLPSY